MLPFMRAMLTGILHRPSRIATHAVARSRSEADRKLRTEPATGAIRSASQLAEDPAGIEERAGTSRPKTHVGRAVCCARNEAPKAATGFVSGAQHRTPAPVRKSAAACCTGVVLRLTMLEWVAAGDFPPLMLHRIAGGALALPAIGVFDTNAQLFA